MADYICVCAYLNAYLTQNVASFNYLVLPLLIFQLKQSTTHIYIYDDSGSCILSMAYRKFI